jgi:hypothetical protein
LGVRMNQISAGLRTIDVSRRKNVECLTPLGEKA